MRILHVNYTTNVQKSYFLDHQSICNYVSHLHLNGLTLSKQFRILFKESLSLNQNHFCAWQLRLLSLKRFAFNSCSFTRVFRNLQEFRRFLNKMAKLQFTGSFFLRNSSKTITKYICKSHQVKMNWNSCYIDLVNIIRLLKVFFLGKTKSKINYNAL